MKGRLVLPAIGLLLVSLLAYACNSRTSEAAVVSTIGERRSISASTGAARRAGVSMVRFVNAMPGSPSLELLQDSTSLFANVVFGAVSPYKQVRDDSPLLTLRRARSQADVTRREQLRDGSRYTVIALSDRVGGLSLRVIRDQLLPDSGKARVRLIHAAPQLDRIAVAMTGQRDPLFADVAFDSESGFRDIVPGTAGFMVRNESQGKPLVRMPSMALSAGTAYTFILTARPNGELAVILFSDASDTFPVVTRAGKQ